MLNGYTILIKFPNEKLKKKSFRLIIVGWKILKWYNCNFFNTDNQLKSSLGYYYPRNSRSYKLDISLLFHLIWFFFVNLIFGSVIKIYLFFFIFKLKMPLKPLLEIKIYLSTKYNIVLLFSIKPIRNRFGSAVTIWFRKVNGCGWRATLHSTTLTGPMENQAMNLEENIAWACCSTPTITGMMNDAKLFFHLFVKKRRKYVTF